MAGSNLTSSYLDLLRGTDTKKDAVWQKGHPIYGRNASEWRRDDFGQTIRYSAYGDRDSPYGWEIDHIHATILGGSDALNNLRPLHCKRNASLGGSLGSILGGSL